MSYKQDRGDILTPRVVLRCRKPFRCRPVPIPGGGSCPTCHCRLHCHCSLVIAIVFVRVAGHWLEKRDRWNRRSSSGSATHPRPLALTHPHQLPPGSPRPALISPIVPPAAGRAVLLCKCHSQVITTLHRYNCTRSPARNRDCSWQLGV